MPDEPGRKDDAEKPRWDLLPFGPVSEVVAVLTYGARKYAPDNWQRVPEPRRRYFAAAMRHLVAWHEGERTDPETGLSHLAHAVCCLLFLLWFDLRPAKEPPCSSTSPAPSRASPTTTARPSRPRQSTSAR